MHTVWVLCKFKSGTHWDGQKNIKKMKEKKKSGGWI